jgi:hypothetical protein
MRIRVVDLDGSITTQDRVLRMFQPDVFDMRRWGPRLRLATRWQRFFRFERSLDRLVGAEDHRDAWITLLGSGDFHHVTLALLRRLRHPFNLLVLDRDADWLRATPFLHSRSWLHHAARLPNVRRIFHLGGEGGFDNALRWLAPRRLVSKDKIVVAPAVRSFESGFWRNHRPQTLRRRLEIPLDRDRLEEIFCPYLDELDRLPLYVSLDKNVLWMPEAMTNGRSGHLDLSEAQEILQFFMKASGNDLIGMDIVGDWSHAETDGLLRRLLQRFGHPRQRVDADQARLCNERTNMMLLRYLTHDPIAESITFPSRMKSA